MFHEHLKAIFCRQWRHLGSGGYCITLYFRGRKFSRKVNLKYFREKIFSRIYCSRENIFPRKYLPAKITSRENIFSRKYFPAKISSCEFFPWRKCNLFAVFVDYPLSPQSPCVPWTTLTSLFRVHSAARSPWISGCHVQPPEQWHC